MLPQILMKLSFEDTSVAFAHKSNADLLKAIRLFQAFNFPFLVQYGPALANFALSLRLPVKGLIKHTIFHQFCGGESIQSSLPSAQELHANGIGAILDYSVEGKGDESGFEQSLSELMKVIEVASERPEFPFAVFKCTGIGALEELLKASTTGEKTQAFLRFEERFRKLCQHAARLDVKLLIDAEETWIQPIVDELTYEMMAEYNRDKVIIYNTIQMYRVGRLEEIKAQINKAKDNYKLGFKLVRGAYMEKERERAQEKNYPSPIQPNKESCDEDYNAALKLCFDNRSAVSIMAGTHNENSSFLLAEMISSAGLELNDDRFWFAQLYGMSDHISFNLANHGFNVAKYLPYGPLQKVLPYLARRAQENSAVKGQSGRELTLLKQELKRRRSEV